MTHKEGKSERNNDPNSKKPALAISGIKALARWTFVSPFAALCVVVMAVAVSITTVGQWRHNWRDRRSRREVAGDEAS